MGADHAFLVLSGSMRPEFSAGDVIFVSERETAKLQVGDVITYHIKNGSKTLITHRIIERIEDGDAVRYRTQGDANEDPDPWVVKQETIVGKYEDKIPYWGLLMKLVRSKLGYVVFILLPASMVIVKEFAALYRELDAKDRSRKQTDSLLARLEHDMRAEGRA